jgi:O-methyltransferase
MSLYEKLQRISPYFYPRYSFMVENLNSNPLLKKFFDENKGCPVFDNKTEHFRYLSMEVINDNPIDYLEFGVYKGNSIREWMRLNQHTESRFFGFDTFTGLPENWTYSMKKGAFSAGGNIPVIEDSRVKMVKGLFQNSLRPFLKTFIRVQRL